MTYKHGIYGVQAPTTDALPPAGVGTLPIYIGTAPVQQTSNPAIHVPVILNTFEDAVAKLGYSDNWSSYTLCEAIYAHFKNAIQPIGPIIAINVLDPSVHKKEGSQTIEITNGVGYITAPAVLGTLSITGKTLGTDYTAAYTDDGRIKIAALPGKTLAASVTVEYSEVDASKVLPTDVIGGTSGGIRKGIAAVDLVYQTLNVVPTILAAPGWSHQKAVKEALVSKANLVNGHWDAIVVADLDAGSTADSIDKAIAWKIDNGYNDLPLKVVWPKARKADRTFWGSTLAVVQMQQTDFANDNVPYETPSNKQVDAAGTAVGSGPIYFDEIEANQLNAKGITTFLFKGGIWVLWGAHNANYEDGAPIDPKNVFDASIRMQRYLTNTFQARYAPYLDGPLTRSLVDTILNDAGVWLNSLVAEGKLLSGSIAFHETSNLTSSMVTGDFLFDVLNTTTPVAKSLTFRVRYTTAGLATLFGGEN
ncbi:hypothetical protein [Gorillibacterium sp. CAU 1737]|uniref:hypothetical protein n=1 Tax=Gorillibacterium sp. CAU 1737 TaxID=3140362 RepID=UPI0032616248